MLLAFGLILLPVFLFDLVSSRLDFYPGLRYRRRLTVFSEFPGPLTHHEESVSFPTEPLVEAGKLLDNCSDLLFGYRTPLSDSIIHTLPWWAETPCPGVNGLYTVFWVNLTLSFSPSTDELFVFYGFDQTQSSVSLSDIESASKRLFWNSSHSHPNDGEIRLFSTPCAPPWVPYRVSEMDHHFVIGSPSDDDDRLGVVLDNVGHTHMVDPSDGLTCGPVSSSTGELDICGGGSGTLLGQSHVHAATSPVAFQTESEEFFRPRHFTMLPCVLDSPVLSREGGYHRGTKVQSNMVLMFRYNPRTNNNSFGADWGHYENSNDRYLTLTGGSSAASYATNQEHAHMLTAPAVIFGTSSMDIVGAASNSSQSFDVGGHDGDHSWTLARTEETVEDTDHVNVYFVKANSAFAWGDPSVNTSFGEIVLFSGSLPPLGYHQTGDIANAFNRTIRGLPSSGQETGFASVYDANHVHEVLGTASTASGGLPPEFSETSPCSASMVIGGGFVGGVDHEHECQGWSNSPSEVTGSLPSFQFYVRVAGRWLPEREITEVGEEDAPCPDLTEYDEDEESCVPLCNGLAVGGCGPGGECASPDQCVCFSDWGKPADQEGVWSAPCTVEETTRNDGIPVAAGVGIGVAFTLGVLCVFAVIVTVVVVVVVRVRRKRLGDDGPGARASDAKLDEQMDELTESGKAALAKLTINQTLFEIEYSSLIVQKKIGSGIVGIFLAHVFLHSLSGGSSAAIFVALYEGKTVAFKCFRLDDFLGEGEVFSEFEKEVEVLGSILHPHVLRFFGAILAPPRVGIVMEYCPNGDLKDYIQTSECPVSVRIRLLRETAQAMAFLHRKGVVHRDLKPENVLVSDNVEARLCDFGLSRILDGLASTKTRGIGTSIYMGPELFTGHYDSKIDVFAFGIMMYVTILGCWKPYEEAIHPEVLVASNPSFRPSMEGVEWPQEASWCSEMIPKCWEHDPVSRPTFPGIVEWFEAQGQPQEGMEENGDDSEDSSSSSD